MSNTSARPYLLVIFFAILACKPILAADEQVRVVPASELEQWWQAAPGQSPEPQPPPAMVDGCAAVAFEIHGDGSVSNERVWRSAWTDSSAGKQVEQSFLQAIHQRRFVAAAAKSLQQPTQATRPYIPIISFRSTS